MDYTDETFLINSLKMGKEEAYIYLVDNYSQRLFAYAISLTNEQAMAQDILQNVFLRTWELRKKIGIKSSLQNYLFKSVHNEFISQYRKSQSALTLEQEYFDTLARTVSNYDDFMFGNIVEKVLTEIQNLPPKCREVFILSRKEGLTNNEISTFLNISIKTVEAHITKAFSILRKRLGDKIEITLFMLFGVERNKEIA